MPRALQAETSLTPRSRHFHMQPVGLTVSGTPPFEAWQTFFGSLMRLSNASLWAIGDAILYGENRSDWGEMYSQALDLTQRSYSTLANASHVCRKFEYARRRDTLSFTHHAEVCSLRLEQQEAMLDEAEVDQLSARDLRDRVKALRDSENRSIGAVDTGDEGAASDVVEGPEGQVVLLITCPDEETAEGFMALARLRGATVLRQSA